MEEELRAGEESDGQGEAGQGHWFKSSSPNTGQVCIQSRVCQWVETKGVSLVLEVVGTRGGLGTRFAIVDGGGGGARC